MSNDLIERLRGHSEIMERDKGKFVRFIDVATCTEAADRIDALQAEVARLLGDMVAIDRCSRRNLHAGRKIDAIVTIAERALSRQALGGDK